jgi:serine protease
MSKYFILVIIVLSLLVNVNLYSIDKKILDPDPKSGRYGKVLSDKVYIRFKAQAVPYLNLTGNMNKTANIDAVKLLNNNAVIKLTPLLNPENSITYNNSLIRRQEFNYLQTSQKLMAAEEPLLRTFKLLYDGSMTPERFCKLLLETEASIEIAEPCYINQTQALPNDTYLESESQLKLIKAYDAWKNNLPGSEGAPSVIIAVSDNGIDQSHPDMTGSIARNTAEMPANGKDDDGNGYIDDYLGYNFNFESDGSYDNTYFSKSSHGMNCAGIIGATANNGMGIAGVANKCKLFPIKAGNDDSDIEWGYESIVYAAIRGFKVINCSWGFQFKDFSQIEQSMIDFAVKKDLAVIVASGNKSKSPFERFYPTFYEGVMGVGEVNQNDEITGNNCWSGGIDIMAPGIGNYTTRNNDSYEFAGSGTSFAAPVVAGVVGVVRAKHPNLNALQAIEFTRQCVDDITGIQANQDWKDFLPGRVNFVKAVTLDPFSMPAVKPLNIKYLNNAGIELPRYFMNDTVTIDINAYNYLGAANNLEFRLSVIKDNLQAISLINDVINIPSVQKESAVKLNSYKFVIVNNTKSKVYFRVDITGENGYKDFFIFSYTPSDDVQTYENQKLKFSVCDRGTYGFSPEERGTRNGSGFIYKGYENQLFKGGIAATVNNERVVASVNPDNTSDFYVVKPFYNPDKFTGIVSDELSKIVNLELTQKVQFDENGNTPCMRIEVTAKNIGSVDLMNPSIGYYLDWDIADVYESNKIRLFPEALPTKYTNKAAAHLLQYPYKIDYPVFGIMAYTDEANCQPQAAGFISSSTDPGSQMTWLNSGTSIQLGENKIEDIAEMIGMKFTGALKPGESKKFNLLICAEDNVSKLATTMKDFSLDTDDEIIVNDKLLFSPNPANDKLIINLRGNDNLSGVSVYNLLGYKVSEHTDINVSGLYNLDISGLATGFYYLRAVINGSTVTGSFIIAR